jgi:hypothetical protein
MNRWEIAKNLISLIPAVLALADKGLHWLPVNPAVREEWSMPSILTALVAGLGGYYLAKPKQHPLPGLIGLLFLLLSIAAVASFDNGITFNLTPGQVSVGIRIAYVAFFTFLGLALGGFLGLAP